PEDRIFRRGRTGGRSTHDRDPQHKPARAIPLATPSRATGARWASRLAPGQRPRAGPRRRHPAQSRPADRHARPRTGRRMSVLPRPRKRCGQHFLHDPHYIGRIVSAVAPAPGDRLVEIGPGRGAITVPLARSGAELCAPEVDRDLAALLRERFAGMDDVTIVEADALAFAFAALGSDLRVVGNLPYNISTPLLFRLIGFRGHLRDLHFMLQKEVVDRMAAAPGTRAYGRLTVMLGCYMTVERLFDVPPGAFVPPPRVTSAVVRLRPRPQGEVRIADEAL